MKLILIIFILLILFLFVRRIGMAINNKTPNGGINKSMYVDINGTKQWINIYGKDKNNPVLLYLHGGPGSSTSHIDYAFTRKWADVYTIVTWDQRNCGKSYDWNQNNIPLTKELFLEDGKEITEFLIKYLSKNKLTILGHSWGSIFGANLAQQYPDYYECFIGTGQLVDYSENENAFIKEAMKWAQKDNEKLNLINKLDPKNPTIEYYINRNKLMDKCGYGMMVNGRDYSLFKTIIFNPNYTLFDWIKYLTNDMKVYYDFLCSDEIKSFSLKDKTEYKVSYYNINGDMDYQTNYQLAQKYFNQINAPYKQMYIMKNMTHGLLESDSKGFSEIIHKIAETENKS